MKNPAKMNHIEVLNHIGQLNRQSDLKSQEIKLLKQRIEQLKHELRSLSTAVIQWDDCDTASQVRRAQDRMVDLAKQTDEQLRKGVERE